MRKFLRNVTILFCFYAITGLAQNGPSNKIKTERIIIKVKTEYKSICKEGINNQDFINLTERLNILAITRKYPNSFIPAEENKTHNYVDLSTLYEISYLTDRSLEKIMSDLYNLGLFDYVQPYYYPNLFYIPNDPHNETHQYYLNTVSAYQAWDSSIGDTNIIIGIVDTGIDIDHEDLIDNIAYNYNDPINGIDDDNDGFIDNYRGWDLGEFDNNPQSNVNHHGTQVAGAAAASTNNGIGISGTGFLCKILPVKISDENGDLTQSYEGIVYAADHGCQVINCSWGGNEWHPYGQDIINYATFNRGALVVAAAGNSSNDVPIYPASYDNVLSVAATDVNDIVWEGSSFGYQVDISAPGVNIYFTKNDNAYGSGWGTSYAAPIVSAAAGILHSWYPQYDALQYRAILINTSDIIDTIGQNQDYLYQLGKGRLNMFRSLTDSILPFIELKNLSITTGDTFNIQGEILNLLTPTNDLSVSLSANYDDMSFVNYQYNFGVIATNESLNIEDGIFNFVINDEVGFDENILFKFEFVDGIYNSYQFFEAIVNQSFLELNFNKIKTTITANGRIGYNDYPQKDGNGFIYNDKGNFLYEGGLVIATSTNHVLDNLYDKDDFIVEEKTKDLSVSNNLSIYYSKYSDKNALDNKIGLEINQRVYAWNDESFSDFIIIEYEIVNLNTFGINNLHAGIYADWDIMGSDFDRASTDANHNLLYCWNDANPIYYTGIQVLNESFVNYYAIDNVIGGNGGIDIQNGFSDEEKYFALTKSRPSAGESEFGNDIAVIIATGPYEINGNDTIRIAFALIGGSNLYNLIESAENALIKYHIITNAFEPNTKNSILKVYPNPVINEFVIECNKFSGFTKVCIYNNNGKKIFSEEIKSEDGKIRVETNDIKPGIYYLQIINKTKMYYAKIIIH